MRALKLPSYLFVLTLVLTIAMAVELFGSVPQHVQAQDIATPTPEIQIQIVGGQLADPGEWPWQVALIGSNNNPASHDFWNSPGYQFCGGSLIDPQWVLTAGHCVTEDNGSVTPASAIDIVVGIYDLIPPPADYGYQRRDVIQIIRHSAFNDNTLNNDIALLKLSSPITIGGSGATKTGIIPLVPSNIGSLTGINSWVTGWGNTSTTSTGNYPELLNEVQLPIISNSVCNNALHYNGEITDYMLCAGIDPAGGKDACQGDSGGPLVVDNDGQWNLAGIVSWGYGCGDPLNPGVYTRVSNYVSWVNTNVDLTPPTVVASVRASADPANTASVNFTVTFSETVTGVNASDFSLTTSGVSGAAVSGVSASPSSVYTVTVNTGTGSGTIRLDVVDNDSIVDTNSKPLNGAFTGGETYDIDKTAPTITSITRLNSNPTASASINFLVTFSEPVDGVDSSDFSLNTTGVVGAVVSKTSGSGATHTVKVSTGSGDGTIRLDAIDNDTITDPASNPLIGGFAGGEAYSIDKPALPAPTLRSPRTKVVMKDTTPTFHWTAVRGGESYEIQFASDDAFTTSVDQETVTGMSFTFPTPFADGSYFWHVRAYNVNNQAGSWSPVRTFEMDNSGPIAPLLNLPDNNAFSNRTPAFKWLSVPTAVLYEFQYDDNSGFSSPTKYTAAVRGTFRRPAAMGIGTYYWHVRAMDASGNWGPWSAFRVINITAP